MNRNTTEMADTTDFGDVIDVAEVVGLFLKHKWLILGGSLSSALLVCLIIFISPRQYQSQALILVSQSIIKPSISGDGSAQLSEIAVSSLEASTYEILAKSDELLLTLADTLSVVLDRNSLLKISSTVNVNSIAKSLSDNMEVELLQETGRKNVRSNTPILVLRYKTNDENLPPIIVNTWASLFLQQHRGLSSNVTDEFYQNVVLQYEQAKNNLERKESELSKVNAVFNDLNQLKTEMKVKTTQVSKSLEAYKEVEGELAEKHREYSRILAILKRIVVGNSWVGYSDIKSLTNLKKSSGLISEDLVDLIIKIDKLTQDSTKVYSILKEESIQLKRKLFLEKVRFEQEAKIEIKRLRVNNMESELKEFRIATMELEKKIFEIESQVISLTQSLAEQEPVLIVRKAITDEALWEHNNTNGQNIVQMHKKLKDYGLISEEVNPTYLTLKDSLASKKNMYYLLKNRLLHIQGRIDTLEKKIPTLLEEIAPIEIERNEMLRQHEKLTTQLQQKTEAKTTDINLQLSIARNALLIHRNKYEESQNKKQELKFQIDNLSADLSYHRDNYQLWRDQTASLSTIVDSLSLELRQIERDITVYSESFERLAKLKEEARIALQQAAGDIQIVSKAKVAKMQSKDTIRKTGYSFIASLLIFSILILLRNTFEKSKASA